jgi:MinD superfamily P-loop ATPase
MQELVVISGKGGTGKTTLTASFAALAQQAVLADCDVDAADLHLLLHPKIHQRTTFQSGFTAVIDPERCTQCGLCREVCRFEAIDASYTVNPFACEGCKVCVQQCPAQAIDTKENICGEWYISDTSYGLMAHARLGVAEENSGKLVAIVRQQAKRLAEEHNKHLLIIDGPPGIGCPVISAITGTDLVLVVTEPTLSGLHDLKRVTELTGHFGIATCVCINKFDINPDMTQQIEQYCEEQHLNVIGKIPYDLEMVNAVVARVPLVSYSQGEMSQRVSEIWQRMEQVLQDNTR